MVLHSKTNKKTTKKQNKPKDNRITPNLSLVNTVVDCALDLPPGRPISSLAVLPGNDPRLVASNRLPCLGFSWEGQGFSQWEGLAEGRGGS